MEPNNNNLMKILNNKYFYLLLIGSIRLFLCVVLFALSKFGLYDIFGPLINSYQKFETIMLPTIILVGLPFVFALYDQEKYDSKEYLGQTVTCTVVWMAATLAQILFIQQTF